MGIPHSHLFRGASHAESGQQVIAPPVAARDVAVGESWAFTDHLSQAQLEYVRIRDLLPLNREGLAFARLLRIASCYLTDGAALKTLRPRLAACLLAGDADDAIELTAELIA